MVFQITLILNFIALALFVALLTRRIATQPNEVFTSQKQRFISVVALLCGSVIASVFWWYSGRTLNPIPICLLVVFASCYALYRPSTYRALAASTGFLLFSLASVTHTYSLPIWIGLLMALCILIVSSLAVTHKHYVDSEHIREDALFIVLSLALLICVIPPIEQGWQSARTLNVGFDVYSTDKDATKTNIWFYAFLSLPVCVGILASLIKRRSIINKV